MKKQIIRLTESDLHKIIENAVQRVLTENYNNEVLLLDTILDSYQAEEIASDMNFETPEEAAAYYFKEIGQDTNNSKGQMPKYNRYVQDLPEINGELYYDYGADYYFVVINQ